MFSKLKYILFDFSDNFKNDYLSLTKKTIIFLVAGIIMFSFINSNNTVYTIGCFAIIIFGFLWGINLAKSLFSFTNISSNIMIRMTLKLIVFAISFIFGYIYFIWSTIKFIIVLIKKQAKK
jgi:hypothetical protein